MTEVVGYRLCAKKPVGRSAGKSVVNTAAYISRSKLFDDELGKSFSYQNRHSEVLFSDLLMPECSPEIFKNREVLWNGVQRYEKHKKAQFARLLEINLPHQLSIDAMKELLIDFVKNNFINLGMIADVNIHHPDIKGDQRNYHAHVLLTLRRVNKYGFVGNKAREWNSRKLFNQWRENLALSCSQALKNFGYEIESERWKYGHLTLQEQRFNALERYDDEYAEVCDHLPTLHKGVHIHQMERKGIISYVEEDRRELKVIAEIIYKKQLVDIDVELKELLQEEQILEDNFLRKKFGHTMPSLEDPNRIIDDELRVKLKGIVKELNAKKRKNEIEYEDDYER